MSLPDSGSPLSGERSYLIDDAARLLGVSRRTIYYRIREGRLRTIRAKCGSQRVLMSSIEAELAAAGSMTTTRDDDALRALRSDR
jgi:excisionase family DNA binding protein